MPAGEVWGAFEHDPRDPVHAGLRASDSDREVLVRVLSTAYADGRLDREEFDQRSETLSAARTLGELPPLVADLVPERTLVRPSDALATLSPSQLDARAVEAWRERRRQALWGFIGPSLICWAIYLAINGLTFDSFVWPLIVSAATGLNLLRVAASREQVVREERQQLVKQQAKALRKRHWRA
ncbi:hypothetical protein BH11ACT8_BH11ACT8_05640 [soil metagenome]